MFEGLMDWLSQSSGNSGMYLFWFLIFCILAAVVLPIPIELGLLGMISTGFSLFGLSVYPSFIIVSSVLGLGKAIGSFFVFHLGLAVEEKLHSRQNKVTQWFLKGSTKVVGKAGYIGLYLLLIIPGMADTLPLYAWSFMNKEGDVLDREYFILTNFIGGFARALMVGIFVSAGFRYFA
jgi:membrane protein YqaA with SNARE-associated domain